MCLTLAELRAALSAYAAGFDADVLAPAQLAAALGDAGAIEKMAGAVSSLVAARMAMGSGLLGGNGTGKGGRAGSAQRAAQALAQASGTSLGDARRAIEAGQALAGLPEVAAAARAGELSRPQAWLVAGAAGANPAATTALLEKARTGALGELAEEAGRARAAVEDLDARRRALRGARSLRSWTGPLGTWQLVARGLPEDGALVMAAVGRLADQAFEAARAEGRREAPEAYAYDGLVALAGGAGPGPGYEVMVRVDHSALLRGRAEEGETCELAGFGPVSAQVVLELIETGDPFLKAIVTKGKDVVGVAHLGRRPNAYQRSALDWLFPTCAAAGCGVRAAYLQTDHRADWARTHVTMLELLDRLCRHHHGLKTHQGWALVPGRGKRPFVPPDDPRHPGPAPGPETGCGHAPRTGPAHDPGPGPGPREAHPPGPASGPAPSGPAPYRPAPSGPARHSDRA
jgi:hypothetical protein